MTDLDSPLPKAPPGEIVSPLGVVRLISSDVARSLGRTIVRGRGRDEKRVAAEYDAGNWLEVLETRAWESAANLESFLHGTRDEIRPRNIDGTIKLVGDRAYYAWRIEIVQKLLGRVAGESETLLELGCGFGVNLFSLSLGNRWQRLIGFDLSQNALTAGRLVANRFAIHNVEFRAMDLADRSDPHWANLRGQTVFTYFCLEQLRTDLDSVLSSLRDARPRRVIHIESAAGMWAPNLLDFASAIYVHSMGYQTTLHKMLRRLASQNQIRIVTRERLRFSPTVHNDPSLIVWEPSL